MRSLPDCIHQTILFEAIAITLFAVSAGWISGRPVGVTGSRRLMFSALSIVWNLVFNWLFDF
jgi:uncharacterized membrane protein